MEKSKAAPIKPKANKYINMYIIYKTAFSACRKKILT